MTRIIPGFIIGCILAAAGGAAWADEEQHSIVVDAQEKWTGDLDGMVERRRIRALVVYNKMFYFLDRGTQMGIAYDLMKQFEAYVNKKTKPGSIPVRIVFVPVARDQLLPALLAGRGDVAAANLTITPVRSRQVGFSTPFLTEVNELLVTGPDAEEVRSLDDLSGQIVHVRPSSSYFESLARLNQRLQQQGMDPVEVVEADENLEDSDLLEMLDAGVLSMVVVDSHKARFWKDIFTNITVREDIVLNNGGEIAWAFRKNSPKFKNIIDGFAREHKKGTLIGNLLFKRYLEDNQWVNNSLSKSEIQKFRNVTHFLQKYADTYDFDWLMLGALAYQESGLDQNKRSAAGAIGVMQILPSTAKDPNVGIPDIKVLENNIHAGAKYLRFLQERYFNDPGIDELNRTLFTFASYNAGPARVAGLRAEAGKMGLDPARWFGNVEIVAAKRIGFETVSYVGNIYKYFVAYRLFVDRLEQRGDLGIEE